MKNKILLIAFLLSSLNLLQAQEEELFERKTYIKNNDTLKYRMLFPKDFSEEKKYPVVLFLHGGGERGNNNTSQLTHGSKLFTNEVNRDAFPAIVIFPQCSKEDYWANANVDRSAIPLKITFPTDAKPTKSLSLVINLMDEIIQKSYVKTDQIYVGGLSMGGMGTFEILYRKPELFTAAFAICGGGNPETTKVYAKTTQLWVFHGAKDDVVNPLLSVQMVAAILKAGGQPNFTLYANDNHNSWDSAFAEPKLLSWLFSKSN